VNTLRVLSAGLSTTVQDLGRPGYMSSGVPAGGAADTLSLRAGNLILNNPPDAAALEITLAGDVIEFTAPATIAFAGADTPEAAIESDQSRRVVSRWTPTPVGPGERLCIGSVARGARAYLCIAGGVRTAPVLGSRSTHAASGLGHPGRPLVHGDELPLDDSPLVPEADPLPAAIVASIETHLARRRLRVLPAAHLSRFSVIAEDQLFFNAFTIADRSDRTGVRVDGPRVPSPPGLDVSEPALPGAIQVPPAGRPIILGPDGPTIGGYPMPFAVISADLPALAQLAPRDTVRFERTTLAGAHAATERLESLIGSIASGGALTP